ncbi:MAG: hypothetical protein KIPDCIKN_01223 [Haliscomenobacter sp.]|jgi:hypothetical protein|nr:hypothetical protein [Haliscomenobacter sp.]
MTSAAGIVHGLYTLTEVLKKNKKSLMCLENRLTWDGIGKNAWICSAKYLN